MNRLRAYYKLFFLIIIILNCIIPVMLRAYFGGNNLTYGLKKRQRAAQQLVRLLGIKIQLTGNVVDGNYLYIANHRSYIDPVLIAVYSPILAVAKAEVAKWPLLGFGAKVTGAIFVERENKDSRRDTLHSIRIALKDGFPLLIFPEGTSSDLPQTLPFRRGSFQIAAEENIGVVPISIEYADKTNAFIGTDTFIPHFLRCFSKPTMLVSVHFGDIYYDNNADVLMKKIKETIDEQLFYIQQPKEKFSTTNIL